MNVLAALLDLFIPRECHICGCHLIAKEEFVCSQCMQTLPVTNYEKYWDNKSGVNTDLNPMEHRFAGQIPLDHACAPYFYTRDSALATLIHDFKYRGFSKLATTLGEEGALRLKDSVLFAGIDVLLPVPLHYYKQLKRGYNQSEMIARGVSRVTGIPVGCQLKASRSHRTQTSLTASQRHANTQGIFKVENPETLAGKKIMLVDDICTTGATLLSASSTLLQAVEGIRLSVFTLGVV